MSSCWATRRASSTSDTLQQPVSLSPPHSRIVTPTTSWPSRAAARPATDESTPPLIATITRIAPIAPPIRWRSVDDASATTTIGARRRRRRWSCGRGSAAPRRPPSAGRRPSPPARATRSIAPLAHAEAADAQTLGPIEQVQQRLALDRPRRARGPSRPPWPPRHGLADAAGPSTRPATRRSRRAPMRTISDGPLGVGLAPAPSAAATIPATLWVPLRRSRSWPPPTISGSTPTPSRIGERRRRPWGRRTCGR